MLHHIKKHKHWLLVSVLALGGSAWDIHVLAGSPVTGAIAVSTTVFAPCSIASGASLNFSSYDPTSASPLNGQGSFSLTCIKGTEVQSIGLDNGQHNQNNQRQMQGVVNNDQLQYNIYQPVGVRLGPTIHQVDPGNCSGTMPWNNSENKLLFHHPDGKFAQAHTAIVNVCGQIPALQSNVSADSYNDVVTITVNF